MKSNIGIYTAQSDESRDLKIRGFMSFDVQRKGFNLLISNAMKVAFQV
jgi:hypothetical protein